MLSFKLLLILSVLIWFCSVSHGQNDNIPLVPALYIFGDSTVDTGNSVPGGPYGIDLDPSVSPRWTNGKVISDIFANLLGLPSVPPYSIAALSQNSTTGICYAFEGSGILPETGPEERTFDQQIRYFSLTLKSNITYFYETDHLRKSIFLISLGMNDYIRTYIKPNSRKTPDIGPRAFADFLLNALSERLMRLYWMGGRKFIVHSVWPLGCTPKYNFNWDICNNDINNMIIPY